MYRSKQSRSMGRTQRIQLQLWDTAGQERFVFDDLKLIN